MHHLGHGSVPPSGPDGLSRHRMPRSLTAVQRGATAVTAVLVMFLAGCSVRSRPASSAGVRLVVTRVGHRNRHESGTESAAADRHRAPHGPAADLSEELTGGSGPFVGSGDQAVLRRDYVEHEYVAAGRATSYQPVGELAGDGQWTLRPGKQARYRTRVLVREPADPADASGVVLVEWLNVSGGLDADPEFQTLREEIVRQGHTWVGVSAQQIGVEGGPVAVTVDVPGAADVVGKGLKNIDPARYGSLRHPGDAYAYDIYTQVARAVRVRAGGARSSCRGGVPVGLRPRHLRQRRAATHSRLRRVLRAQSWGRAAGAAGGRRARRHRGLAVRHADDVPPRHRGAGLRPPDRDRRRRDPRLGVRPAARLRHLPAVGGDGHRTRGPPSPR